MEDILIGTTDRTIVVFIPDPASTTGTGKTGLAHSAITVSYTRVETDNDVVNTDVTSSMNALTNLTDAHNDWGWKEVSSTLSPGLYRLDLADALFASGAWYAVVSVAITSGLTVVTPKAFRLVAFNALDGVRLGLTALPNAAADAAGGLIISDAGGLDADAQLVTKINDILTDTGTTLQGELDGIQADTEDIQTRLPAALVSGRIDASVGAMAADVITAAAIATGAIDADAIAANAIGASELAADAVTEIQSGLATAADLATVAGYLDAEIAAILADTDELQTDWADGGRLDLILDARASQASVDTVDNFLDTEIAAILADTNELQTDWADGGRLDLILDARASQTSVDTVDNFLDTEIAAIIASLQGLAPISGTIGGTGNDTTHLHLTGLAYGDDGLNGMRLVIKDVSTGLFYSRQIEDFANAGDLATVATLPFTPEDSVDTYWILPEPAIEGAEALVQTMRLIRSAALGKTSGFVTGSGTGAFRDLADSKDRITAVTDSDGNRTSITTDAT